MDHECLLTEECPGYDLGRGMCLVRPDDCELSPADDDGAPGSGAPEPLSSEHALEAAPR